LTAGSGIPSTLVHRMTHRRRFRPLGGPSVPTIGSVEHDVHQARGWWAPVDQALSLPLQPAGQRSANTVLSRGKRASPGADFGVRAAAVG
jgi:hypothetical protein